jgi:hypothetical protein
MVPREQETPRHPLSIDGEIMGELRKIRGALKISDWDWLMVEEVVAIYNFMVDLATSPDSSPTWQAFGWGGAYVALIVLIQYLRELLGDYSCGETTDLGGTDLEVLQQRPAEIIDHLLLVSEKLQQRSGEGA